ncbi:hypothetical protein BZA70DRAFT_290077 [Myxozyma melibiosi]|uniref:Uncharacterized protein n=1 Tax=Myxozyma melibiosi TaxID=54550 RepID=A0ABR1F4J4_9ASCO
MVSIDNVVYLIIRIVLNPLVAAAVLFYSFDRSNRALNTDLEHLLPQIYAILVITYSILELIVDATRASQFDISKDVIAITGGSSGFGYELSKEFAKRKLTVAVLDVGAPKVVVEGVRYYKCDVRSSTQVKATFERVSEELGAVTVLVNNAGITRKGSVLDASLDDIKDTLDVNLLSHFYTVKAVLPSMIAAKKGYVVTVASCLGYQGPVNFAAYGASKAGLLAYHESLTFELAPNRGLKTLLIVPGQMRTGMFSDIDPPLQFFAPVVDPAALARKVVRAIEMGKSGRIASPLYVNFMPVLRAAPFWLVRIFRGLSGMDRVARDSHSD